MHAGVMTGISDTVFEDNGAGSEGPAVLSLGLLSTMEGVTFDGNGFFCEQGTYGMETDISSSSSSSESYQVPFYSLKGGEYKQQHFLIYFVFSFVRKSTDSAVGSNVL